MKADVDKTRLDQVFNLNESSDIFSFMKDYAYKNQARYICFRYGRYI